MKKSTTPYYVKQLIAMVEDGRLKTDSSIQRRGGQWDDFKQSLLIHSMLAGYIIPPLYFTKEPTGNVDEKGKPIFQQEIVDGLQRITSIKAFVNDEWALSDKTPDVEVDGETVVLAGKLFSELPDEIQTDIKRFAFTVYNLEEFTDDEIEEIFFRLNNGVALTKGQQSKAKLGVDIAKFINEVLESKFYKEIAHFSPMQYRRAADQLTLLQSMLLLDVVDGNYELKSISENDVLTYAESIRGNYPIEKRDRIRNIVEYMERALDSKEKFMKKINIPMFFVVADKAIKDNVDDADFYNWFREFADSYSKDCEYAQYCSSGSVKKVNTMERIRIMQESFAKYLADNNMDDAETTETAETTENQEETFDFSGMNEPEEEVSINVDDYVE